MRRWISLCLLLLATLPVLGKIERHYFDTGKLGFGVQIEDLESSYQVLALFVLPGERLRIRIEDSSPASSFRTLGKGGIWGHVGFRYWQWTAPEHPGLYPQRIQRDQDGAEMLLNLVVMVPQEEMQNGSLEGYRIGRYPNPTGNKDLPIYDPPAGFIRVTEELADLQVSPHFSLSQFLCRQEGDFPKFLVLDTKLLLKLEMLLEKVNHQGIQASTFEVMSGYRTPHHNASLGNVRFSRHLYGGAADIFIDEYPKDGRMDDLNRDGRINAKDGQVLAKIIEEMDEDPETQQFEGGLGSYRKKSRHGPFVHVDVRGYHIRWGDSMVVRTARR